MAKVSTDFLEGPQALTLAQMGKLWGQTPSSWFPDLDPVTAFQIDLACAVAQWEWERLQMEQTAKSVF